MTKQVSAILLMLCLASGARSAAMEHSIGQLNHIQQRSGITAISYALIDIGTGETQTGAFGYYSTQKTHPVTSQSLFRIGSLTKSFTALTALKQVQEGRFDIDRPIRSYWPDIVINNAWQREHPVTTAMMLEHVAGIQDLTREEFDYPKPLELQQAFSLAPDARKVVWQPGLMASYSNAGAGYVQAALESATGIRWEQQLMNLVEQLDMSSTGVEHSPDLMRQLVAGYDEDATTPIPYWHTLFRGFGNMHSTADDMAKFVRMLMNNGIHKGKEIISEDLIARMEHPSSSILAELNYGYGLGLDSYYSHGVRLWGHSGDADGYMSHFAYSRRSGRGFFVAINAYQPATLRRARNILEEWLTKPLQDELVFPKVQMSSAELSRYTGVYRQASQRFPWQEKDKLDTATISQHNGGLMMESYRHGQVWFIPVREGQFRRRNEGGATHLFIKSDQGLILVGDIGNYVRTGELKEGDLH